MTIINITQPNGDILTVPVIKICYVSKIDDDSCKIHLDNGDNIIFQQPIETIQKILSETTL